MGVLMRGQDMCDTKESMRAVEDTIKQLGGIDIVIANAVCIHASPCTYEGR